MYLLDTHTFLWYVTGDDSLPAEVIDIISSADHVYLSIVSLWEIAIKQSINKLTYSDSIPSLAEICRQMNVEILYLDLFSVERIKALPFIHRDPFDRILIAQALTRNLSIVTKDENILKYEVPSLSFK